MRAAIYKKYGPPEVVHLAEIPTPTPGSNEILVEVKASTVNRTDAGFRSAEYVVSRFWSGLLRPKLPVLGCEFAGIVASVGAGVTAFKVGDGVFGFNDQTFGGHGEYLVISENAGVALIPDGMDFTMAAALTEGSHYALVDIRAAKVAKGQAVLVNGATGAIGSAAVQLLKEMGVHVTAVCNTKNVDLVRGLGADVVIDYQTEDFRKIPARFDFIFDAVGKSSFSDCKALLKEKGIYISTELGAYGSNICLALLTPIFGGKRVLFPIPIITKEDVLFIKTLAEKGTFTPIIDRIYPLSDIVEAYRYVATGQKTGNVIIQM